jgi:CheY-like chemotaxis protein
MTDQLLSLRILVVTRSDLPDLFRQAASISSISIEVLEAVDAAGAKRLIASRVEGIDLAYLDAALLANEMTGIISATRAAAKPPFTVHLATGAAVEPFDADGLAGMPARLEQARWLLERSIRVRLPSRVLVVDDSATMRSIVRKTLAATRFSLEISEAEEGLAALKMAHGGDFDIVFLDYNMPGFSGLQTLAEFKREKRRAKVVLMTSTQDETVAERARAQGAGFLKKPFFPADIETALCGFYGLRALNPKRA